VASGNPFSTAYGLVTRINPGVSQAPTFFVKGTTFVAW
jgi:hypothetical protein